MSNQEGIVFGIDLGTTYSCISYIDEYGKPLVITNNEHELTTPSVVQFEGDNRIVGKEAKNSAQLAPDDVVEMVKRHMGEENWHFTYEGKEYTAEEISSYILRKLADDTEQKLDVPVKDVVITCPAYFGIAQRKATAQAGEIAGFNVREVINEPTAAAITYGLQNEQDQVVLVYDLGGGTFDITVIEIKGGSVSVIATGGDNNLGGRNWDDAIVVYLAEQWKNETGSFEDPTDSPDTVQELWLKAENAKQALSAKNETKVVVTHSGQPAKVVLTREKFNELTANLLDRTILFTKMTMDDAKARGYQNFDKILLVGGSTKMPQVSERLEKEFAIPLKIFEPDEAVAKGAAIYGQKLLLDQKIQIEIDKLTKTTDDGGSAAASPAIMQQAQEEVARELGLRIGAVKKFGEIVVGNVASHSFGIVAMVEDSTTRQMRDVISNLVVVNDRIPVSQTRTFGTAEDGQKTVELKIMETTEKTRLVEQDRYTSEAEIGSAVIEFPSYLHLPAGSPIEVTFELNRDGTLNVVGREPSSGTVVTAILETKGGISDAELQEAKARATGLVIA